MPIQSAAFFHAFSLSFSGNAWVNEPNAEGDPDGLYASCPVGVLDPDGPSSDYLLLDSSGVGLPAGSYVRALQLDFYRHAGAGDVRDAEILLTYAGAPFGNDLSIGFWPFGSDGPDSVSVDLSQYGFTEDDIGSLGVRLRFVVPNDDAAGDTGFVDSVVGSFTFDRIRTRTLTGQGW